MKLGDGTDSKMVTETEAREEGEDGRLRPGPRSLIPVSSASLDSVASTYFRVSTLTISDNDVSVFSHSFLLRCFYHFGKALA